MGYQAKIRTHSRSNWSSEKPGIKIHATETELKDYEVIELALTEFFKKH